MHTVEPLVIADRIEGLIDVRTEDGLLVAAFRYSQNQRITCQAALANARLFIAAPELLQRLKETNAVLAKMFERGWPLDATEIVQQNREFIAKIENPFDTAP